jgi:hypothetical protein
MSSEIRPRISAILPCNDVKASEAFFNRLGYFRKPITDDTKTKSEYDDYCMLFDDKTGLDIHLTEAVEGWLIPGKNPFALYIYVEDVDGMAERFKGEIIEKSGVPEHKPWGMYEFALSAPDETCVRVGWPSRLMASKEEEAG